MIRKTLQRATELKFVIPNSNYGQSKKGPKHQQNPLQHGLYIAFGMSKLNHLRTWNKEHHWKDLTKSY